MRQSSLLQNMTTGDVRRAYKRWAPVYDATFGKFVEAGIRQAAGYLNQYSGKLLDAGVGTGLALQYYSSNLAVTGVDLSSHMLQRARERAEKSGKHNIEALLEMDAMALEFPENTFDLAVAMYVMTVVPDPVKVMDELARVVRPGGKVIIVNHFSVQGGIRGAIEKRMSKHAKALGWRPEFPISAILGHDRLKLLHQEAVRPFGFFTLLEFEKFR
jgi:phosphatidylethanolamine/phosphatidyl-N-methylethanolamine N-methyltransferase